MRRPLDWFVVALSLLVLWTHRVETDSAVFAARAQDETISSPFAYVNEDGSLSPLAGSFENRDETVIFSQAPVQRLVFEPQARAPRLVAVDRD